MTWWARGASMRRDLSWSDIGCGPVSKNDQAVIRPLTSPPRMTDMKVDDFVAENLSGSGVELSLTGGNQ